MQLLEEIQKKHLETFSFNNIAVLLKQPISLEIEDIIDKIVIKNLGGYCFEHNKLLHDVLRSLGFNVRILIARVINNQDIDTPRTHRITLLEWQDSKYLVDVGFGALCPNTPLKINDIDDGSQKYRIIQNKDNDYQLEVSAQKSYFSLYKFNLARYTQSDCVMGNFYSSNYPNAVFVNNLVIALQRQDKTLSLRNNTYHRIGEDSTEIIDITNHMQLHSIINDDFNIPITEEQSHTLFAITIQLLRNA
ncbi:arylamine N-acetyltransferase [bacterium]|nr:arylamine N-acetyltransferase [bacterium]